MLYLVGERARWASLALGAVFLLNGIAPLGGNEGGLESAILLVVAIGALALGSHADADHPSATRRWPSRRDGRARADRARAARRGRPLHLDDPVEADTAATRRACPRGGAAPASIRRRRATRWTRCGACWACCATTPARASTRPQPGLDRLNELLDAGAKPAPTSADRPRTRRPLPAGVDLAAYRILQESLTNARRRRGGRRGRARLRRGRCGCGCATRAGAGRRHGCRTRLVGMRERAAAAGGSLRAGRRTAAGFAVEADLPL